MNSFLPRKAQLEFCRWYHEFLYGGQRQITTDSGPLSMKHAYIGRYHLNKRSISTFKQASINKWF